MAEAFEPNFAMLPPAQRELWPALSPAQGLGFVLYGGTAVALYLGHRISVDFDFFSSAALDKAAIARSFVFLPEAVTILEDRDTLVVSAPTKSGPVKVSFFGKFDLGRINAPQMISDGVLAVASRDDLLATTLKAILDRSEAKDYSDIAALLAAGTSLERGLGGFTKMFGKDAVLPLRALGYFGDGDLATLPAADKAELCAARDRVKEIPDLTLRYGPLTGE